MIEGLKQAISEIEAKRAFAIHCAYSKAYIQALDDMLVILRAMVSRLDRGAPLQPYTEVG